MRAELRRMSDPFHAVAVKNVADRMTRMGMGRSEALEALSRRDGHADWNSYRASGRARLRIKLEGGHLAEIKPGISRASADIMTRVSCAAVAAAFREGMGCGVTGPIVLSDMSGIPLYRELARRFGMALSPEVGPRVVSLFEDADADLLLRTFEDLLRGHGGLIIVDLPNVSSERNLSLLRAACPNAVILIPASAQDQDQAFFQIPGCIRFGGGTLSCEPLRQPRNDVTEDRTVAMLTAFVKAGIPLDPLSPPPLHSIPWGHPAMDSFLRSLPGYSLEKREALPGRGHPRPQDSKAEEQFRFLVSNI